MCGSQQGRGREAETEGDTGPEADSALTVSLEPMNREIMTWAEAGRLANWATQAPLFSSIL